MEFSLVVPTGVSKNADAVWLIDQMDGISVYEFSLNPREGIEFKEMSDWYRKDENLEIARSILGIESEEGGK
ncbi:hypothetical protein PODOV087v1_p0016 [Vibrio phage 431E45.1]|nr:hypothetical protein PODOV087v1_p0016 [Vibrio phage 431E45.1]